MKKVFIFISMFIFFIFLQVIKGEIYLEELIIVVIYLSINFFSKNFKLRSDNLFLPQNIAFLVFFIRLYFLPCLGLFFEYRIFSDTRNTESELIFNSYIITLLMYLAFVIGWEVRCFKFKNNEKQFHYIDIKKIKFLSWMFLFFGLTSLVLYYGDFTTYITKIFIASLDDDIKVETSILGYFANLATYFLPFAVFGFISLIDINNKSTIIKNVILIISIVLVLFFSLSKNRQAMVYPSLALFAGFSVFIQFKPLKTIFIGLIVLYSLFVFGNIRGKEEVNLDSSAKNTKEIVNDIQVYAGGSQMIAPVFKMEEKKFTIFSSFITSAPIIGIPFRENSGVKLYNYLFYGYIGPSDQIFLTQAECYTNGGYLLIIIFFLIVGYYYSYLNKLYINNVDSQFLYRVTLFYLVLLFNATILLSFQVMGQFLFFNAVPALIILIIYKENYKVIN